MQAIQREENYLGRRRTPRLPFCTTRTPQINCVSFHFTHVYLENYSPKEVNSLVTSMDENRSNTIDSFMHWDQRYSGKYDCGFLVYVGKSHANDKLTNSKNSLWKSALKKSCEKSQQSVFPVQSYLQNQLLESSNAVDSEIFRGNKLVISICSYCKLIFCVNIFNQSILQSTCTVPKDISQENSRQLMSLP